MIAVRRDKQGSDWLNEKLLYTHTGSVGQLLKE